METEDEIPEDEEEILVYVEFEGLIDGNAFSDKQLQLDVIGIDTDHPIMQINGKFYEGTYEDVIGTYMLFARNDNSTIDDPVFDVAANFQYFAKTRKLLKMQRIFVKPRTEVLGDSEHGRCIPNLNTIKEAGIPCRYQEKALSFWRTVRSNRLNALHSYLEKQRIREEKRSEGVTLDSESDEDNPFAVYKHEEELSESWQNKNIAVHPWKKSCCCNGETAEKSSYSGGISAGGKDDSNTGKCSCLESRKESVVSSDSESFCSNIEKDLLTKLGKDCKKTEAPVKTKFPCNRRKLRHETKRATAESNVSTFGTKDKESLSTLKRKVR